MYLAVISSLAVAGVVALGMLYIRLRSDLDKLYLDCHPFLFEEDDLSLEEAFKVAKQAQRKLKRATKVKLNKESK